MRSVSIGETEGMPGCGGQADMSRDIGSKMRPTEVVVLDSWWQKISPSSLYYVM